ncbi:MAG: hypothetical protein LM559_01125 [Pyrobaculum sp.]|nr:hypothetical protein [Pyrobaculum sp.]
MFLREVLQMAQRFGAFTAAQAAVYLGLPLDEAARRLDAGRCWLSSAIPHVG